MVFLKYKKETGIIALDHTLNQILMEFKVPGVHLIWRRFIIFLAQPRKNEYGVKTYARGCDCVWTVSSQVIKTHMWGRNMWKLVDISVGKRLRRKIAAIIKRETDRNRNREDQKTRGAPTLWGGGTQLNFPSQNYLPNVLTVLNVLNVLRGYDI